MTSSPANGAAEPLVFVVDRAAFFGGDWPQGFQASPADPAELIARARAAGRFVGRAAAEANPEWKQWIPYCVLCCGDWRPEAPDDTRGIFTFERTRGQGEARLHGARSIGLGGHVEPVDEAAAAGPNPAAVAPAERFFANALWRELGEELGWRLKGPRGVRSTPFSDWSKEHPAIPGPQLRLLGIVNDDSTPVGRVHAGLVYRLDVPLPLPAARESVRVREITKMRGGFASLVEFRQLWQDPNRFESWSQFLIEAGVVGAMGGKSWKGTASAGQVSGHEP